MESKVVTINKKVYHNFEVLETYEAGIELRGSEVKSIRNGNVDIKDSFCLIEKNEVWLLNCRIAKYEKTTYDRLDPERKRRLLLHKSEIKRLYGKLTQKGLIIKPVKMYFNERNMLKILIALCKHKKLYDRKEEIKTRELNRDLQRFKRGI
ncbi:MAG: SsrA-binding protein SmpB [Endomicrobiia bacterium]